MYCVYLPDAETDAPVRLVMLPDDQDKALASVQRMVKGYVGVVRVSADTFALVNDDGLVHGLPPNLHASGVLYPGQLVGAVVITGSTPEGDLADVPTRWIDQFGVDPATQVAAPDGGKRS